MGKNNNSSKHEFAFYLEDISQNTRHLQKGDAIGIAYEEFCYRIKNVLRLKKGDSLIVFDRSSNLKVKLENISKSGDFSGTILEKKENIILKPVVHFLLPLLKKDNFEKALYSLVELGAQTIQPIITQKSLKTWKQRNAYRRFLNIITRAAEQSKNFAFPQLMQPVKLEHYLESSATNNKCLIYFDASGEPAFQIIETIKKNKYENIIVMIGPEGDLVTDEKDLLKKHGFVFYKLTPTILRAIQAVNVSMGILRSFL